MAKRLSRKEKGFAKDIARGETGTQAALNNYDTEDYKTASVIASENLAKPRIQRAIEEALPNELLDEVHREGLFATRGVFVEGQKVAEDADFNVRAKYLDMAYKRKGLYAPDRQITLNVELELPKEIQELAHELLSHQSTDQAGA